MNGYDWSMRPETPCPNCRRLIRGGMSDSYWNHDAMVCSPACGERLHHKIESGMVDGDQFQSFPVLARQAQSDVRVRNMRVRIKQLEHAQRDAQRRARNRSRSKP